MRLQLAIDDIKIDKAELVIKELLNLLDIIEIGTPLIYEEGMSAVKRIKCAFPFLELFADLKIMDAGALEAEIAFQAGADIISVLGVAGDNTIHNAIKTAAKYGKKIMVDMIEVGNIEKRAWEIDQMGVDCICVHNAYDRQGDDGNPLDELIRIKNVVKHSTIAVAGGIKLGNLDEIIQESPDIIIIGGGILNHTDIRIVTEKIREKMDFKGGK